MEPLLLLRIKLGYPSLGKGQFHREVGSTKQGCTFHSLTDRLENHVPIEVSNRFSTYFSKEASHHIMCKYQQRTTTTFSRIIFSDANTIHQSIQFLLTSEWKSRTLRGRLNRWKSPHEDKGAEDTLIQHRIVVGSDGISIHDGKQGSL